MRLTTIINEIIWTGRMRAFLIASPDGERLKRCIKNGTGIPDHLLPGRVIMNYEIV